MFTSNPQITLIDKRTIRYLRQALDDHDWCLKVELGQNAETHPRFKVDGEMM